MILCDRGANFGYDNLVVDMLGFSIMKKVSGEFAGDFRRYPRTCNVAIHLAQLPAVAVLRVAELARASMAVGLAGLFIEAHPDPEHAKCDGPSAPRWLNWNRSSSK